MRRVNLPQRLHRNVEGTTAKLIESLTLLEQCQQITGWSLETPVTIEACDLAVAAIKAEQPFQPLDFGNALGYRLLGGPVVGVVDYDVGGRPKRRPLPSMQAHWVFRFVCRQKKRQPGNGSKDSNDPSA